MKLKQQAIQELLNGLLLKFGNTSENKNKISTKIVEFVKKNPKISVKDLDALEEEIQQKLSINTGNTDISRDMFPNVGLDHAYPKTPKPTRSNFQSLKRINVSPKTKAKPRIFEEQPLGERMNLSDIMMGKRKSSHSEIRKHAKNRQKNDEWALLVRNDSIKYLKETELMKRKKDVMKIRYFNDLFQQVAELKSKESILKNNKHADKALEKKIAVENDEELKVTEIKRIEKINNQKKELNECLERKNSELQQKFRKKQSEKEHADLMTLEYFEDCLQKKTENERARKEIDYHNFSNLNNFKTMKKTEKSEEYLRDLAHLKKNAQIWDESEKNYKKIIWKRSQKAHDITRLEKLLNVKPKALKDYEAEAKHQEFLSIPHSTTEKLNQEKTKLDIDALNAQVKEKYKKLQQDKQMLKEQGDIWVLDDYNAYLEHEEKEKKKKKLQREFKEFYDRQIEDKHSKSIADLRLTNAEKNLNKKSYEEATRSFKLLQ